MSRKMVNEVFFSTVLPAPARQLYVWLAFRGNKGQWLQWPIEKIATEMQCSTRQLRDHLKTLADMKVIKIRWPSTGVIHIEIQEITPEVVAALKPVTQTSRLDWIDEVLAEENRNPAEEKCSPVTKNFRNNKVEKEPIKGTVKTTAPLGAVARKTSDQVLSGAKMRQAQTQMEAAKKRAITCPTPMDAVKEVADPPPVATWELSKWASTLSTAFRDQGVCLQGYNSARVIRPQIEVILTALAMQSWPIEKVYDFLIVWLPKNCQQVGEELFRKDANWLVSLGLITSRLPEVTELYEESGRKKKNRLKDGGVFTF